jgi:hypothetical protein
MLLKYNGIGTNYRILRVFSPAVALPSPEQRWSEDPRDNAVGSRHIFAVTVSEGFQHQSFFPANSAKKQNPKTDNARETRHPIRQQQRLSDSPKPECGIHRVANSPVDAISDKLMAFPHIEAN